MVIRDILLLGDPRLYEVSAPIPAGAHGSVRTLAEDLFDTMAAFQTRHGWGRAIAAPQIGVHKRVVCMHVVERNSLARLRTDAPAPSRIVKVTMINPVLEEPSPERVRVWEDCMSFPEIMVHIENPAAITLRYQDLSGQPWRARIDKDYAQLLIHEVEHLDGKLATQRPINARGLALRTTQAPKDLSWSGTFEPKRS